jgi:hypothetical protein
MTIFSAAQLRALGMGDRWPFIVDVVAGRKGSPLGITRKGTRPTDLSQLEIRTAAATAEASEVAAALALIPAGPGAARTTLEAAASALDSRLAWLGGFDAALLSAEGDYAAALATLLGAEAAITDATAETIVAANEAVLVAQANERAAFRVGAALVGADWAATAAPVCPALGAARARRDRLQSAIESLAADASAYVADPLSIAVAPLAASADLVTAVTPEVE